MFWIPNLTKVIMAWLVQCAILSGYVWIEQFKKSEQFHDFWLIRGLRGFIYVVFTVFALIFIDTNLKLIFFGIAGYSNFTLYFASIVLTFILATEIIIHSFLIAPNLKGTIIFCCILTFFLYLFEFYLNEVDLGKIAILDLKYFAILIEVVFPILVGSIVLLILTSIEIALKKVRPKSSLLFKQFWNKRVIEKRVFNIRFNFALWVLITVELILNLQGLSLLFWISFFF